MENEEIGDFVTQEMSYFQDGVIPTWRTKTQETLHNLIMGELKEISVYEEDKKKQKQEYDAMRYANKKKNEEK